MKNYDSLGVVVSFNGVKIEETFEYVGDEICHYVSSDKNDAITAAMCARMNLEQATNLFKEEAPN